MLQLSSKTWLSSAQTVVSLRVAVDQFTQLMRKAAQSLGNSTPLVAISVHVILGVTTPGKSVAVVVG